MPKPEPKLPMASAVKPTLNISDADWERIELAYGHRLSNVVRQKILEATESFIEEEVFERTAESVSAVIGRITRYERAAGAFSRALRVSAQGEGDDVRFHADGLIEEHFPDSPLPGKRKLVSLCEAMTSLQIACERARRELRPELKAKAEAKAKEDMKKAEAEMGSGWSTPKLKREPEPDSKPNLGPPGYREGDCWVAWIQRLTAITEQHGLPTPSSPFAVLVRELQHHIPGARRHWHSDAALAQGIKRARQK